jgi:Response regulators consisting of a CheY-like receiver domain and a winged-helix DNA-binding domain
VKIVLAEDVGITRRQMEAVLDDMGHTVIATGDGTAALEACFHESPDLVVLDWMMPGLDGLQVCRELRASGAVDTFVLLQTGRGTSDDLTVALEAGVDDYIVKPVTVEHLRARVAIAESRIEQRREHRRTEAELAHARWLAGVGEASLAMQHELNSPLTVLLAELSFALDSGDESERRRAIKGAQAQTHRIAALLRKLAELRSPQSIEAIPGVRMIDLRRS